MRLGMPNIKKIEANTQYNGQLSYHGHNKSIIITSGSLLRAGAGALALGRRGACGLPLPELLLMRWGGQEEGAKLSNASLGYRRRAEGREPRAGGALERTRSRGTGAWGKPQAERQREQFFAFWVFMLGFVELGP